MTRKCVSGSLRNFFIVVILTEAAEAEVGAKRIGNPRQTSVKDH